MPTCLLDKEYCLMFGWKVEWLMSWGIRRLEYMGSLLREPSLVGSLNENPE